MVFDKERISDVAKCLSKIRTEKNSSVLVTWRSLVINEMIEVKARLKWAKEQGKGKKLRQ